MEQIRDLAIVLRWVPYEERHRVVTALTERHGRISALARNSIQSRRFGGTLEPFAASEWRLTERPGAELFRVEGAEIRRAYEGLRKDFHKLALASVFSELMLRLAPEREPCEDLFRLHANALAFLEEEEGGFSRLLGLLNGYLAKLLQWNGTQPRLMMCQGCDKALTEIQDEEKKESLSCLVAEAGWLCPACAKARGGESERFSRREKEFRHSFLRMTPAAVVDFHLSLMAPIRQIPEKLIASEAEHRELFGFLEALLVYHVPGFDRSPLKGLRFLDLKSSLQSSPVNLQ